MRQTLTMPVLITMGEKKMKMQRQIQMRMQFVT